MLVLAPKDARCLAIFSTWALTRPQEEVVILTYNLSYGPSKMRRVKLQMNFEGISWDNEMAQFCLDNLKNVDSILLGRKTAEGFIPYWAEVAEKVDPDDLHTMLGRPLTDIPKIVFSHALKESQWANATILNGNIDEAIRALKECKGKDIIVYGGNSFVSSLIEHELIDQYYFFVNPLAVQVDEPILKFIPNSANLTLIDCKPFRCGTVLLCYGHITSKLDET